MMSFEADQVWCILSALKGSSLTQDTVVVENLGHTQARLLDRQVEVELIDAQMHSGRLFTGRHQTLDVGRNTVEHGIEVTGSAGRNDDQNTAARVLGVDQQLGNGEPGLERCVTFG